MENSHTKVEKRKFLFGAVQRESEDENEKEKEKR
jgi:hypothetical protein